MLYNLRRPCPAFPVRRSPQSIFPSKGLSRTPSRRGSLLRPGGRNAPSPPVPLPDLRPSESLPPLMQPFEVPALLPLPPESRDVRFRDEVDCNPQATTTQANISIPLSLPQPPSQPRPRNVQASRNRSVQRTMQVSSPDVRDGPGFVMHFSKLVFWGCSFVRSRVEGRGEAGEGERTTSRSFSAEGVGVGSARGRGREGGGRDLRL